MTLPKYGTIISLQNEGRLCSCIDQPFPPTTPTHTPRLTHSSLKNAQPLTMCTTFTIPTNIRLGFGVQFSGSFFQNWNDNTILFAGKWIYSEIIWDFNTIELVIKSYANLTRDCCKILQYACWVKFEFATQGLHKFFVFVGGWEVVGTGVWYGERWEGLTF